MESESRDTDEANDAVFNGEVDDPGIGSVLEDGVEIMCDFCSLNQRGPTTCYASLK